MAFEQTKLDLNRARLAFDAARNNLITASWALHTTVLGAKAEVIAQFGSDSQAVYAIGLKRKSDRRRARRSAVGYGDARPP